MNLDKYNFEHYLRKEYKFWKVSFNKETKLIGGRNDYYSNTT